MNIKHTIRAIVVALAALFAVACGGGSKGGDSFVAPSPTLNGATVSWKAVDGAEKYTVTVNGSQHSTTETSYTISVTEPGVYEIYVTAVKGDQRKTSAKLTYTHTATLAAPVLTVSGNVVAWSAVPNASGYDVYVNDALKATVTAPRYVVTETEVGSYTVKIKAKGGAGYNESAFSEPVTITVEDGGAELEKLDAPVITLNKRTVGWTAVSNAVEYRIAVDGAQYATTTETSYNLTIRTEGEYSVTVTAHNPSSDYIASDPSNAVTFSVAAFDITKPVVAYIVGNGATAEYSAAQGKMVQSGYYNDSGLDADFLSRAWRLTPVGDYYKIKLHNGAFLTSRAGATSAWYEAENSGDGQLWELRAAANGGYHLLNKAVGEYFYCADSDSDKIHFWGDADNDLQRWNMFNAEVEFDADMTVLPAPVITLDGAVVGWNAVDGADEYKVYVNGEYATTVEQTTYTIEATAEGLYTVTVIATGEGALDSVQSNEVRYMHSTLDLAKPVYATYTIGETEYVATADDNGFVMLISAAEITDYTPYMWYLEKSGDYYTIKFANGWYLTRVVNGDTGPEAKFAPANGSTAQQWKFTADGFNAFKLNNVEHATAWGWQYFYGDINGVLKFADNTHAWDFVNKNISFTGTVKLAAPTVALNGDVATWNAVDGATGYDVYVNGLKVETITTLSYTLATSGDSIKVKAISTAANTENSYFSNTVTYTDLFANPVVAYYTCDGDGKNKVLKRQDDGSFNFGEVYTEIIDYSKYMWTLEKVTYNGAHYYMIKLHDGKYLSYRDSEGNNSKVGFAEKNEADTKQLWLLVADSDSGTRFKLENLYYKGYHDNSYLGEWWGSPQFESGRPGWEFFAPSDDKR